MKRRNIFQLFWAWLASATVPMSAAAANFPLKKTKAEWRKLVSASAYEVLFEHGTERPGSSPLNAEKRPGTFVCVACNLPLFSAAHKYESGTGWPSFFQGLPNALGTTKYHCSRCGGHHGHVFDDGPKPTGKRFCNNGVALVFVPEGQTLPALRT
jgi:peptide-methionine (R)-S-oxide reductase